LAYPHCHLPANSPEFDQTILAINQDYSDKIFLTDMGLLGDSEYGNTFNDPMLEGDAVTPTYV
jgi:hypothetical protein